MNTPTPEQILRAKDVKPTSNRILVARALAESARPVSLTELDEKISTMYKATIFRILTLFVEHDVVHTIEDGSGSLKYELCASEGHHSLDDMHVHFFCERCRDTFCLEGTPIPAVELPEGFEAHSANYVVKGLCPRCLSKP